ncbi:MAG: hypothetical protein IJB23_03920 [Alistipes sp.]|nr:hypothetical protein [Alistipes sp.]
MKTFGIIVNVVLALGYAAYNHFCLNEYWFAIILYTLLLFGVTTYIYIRICDTPTKKSEVYKTWQDMLPDDSKYKILQWITIGAMPYTYVMKIITDSWAVSDSWWKQTISVFATISPMIILFFFAKGETLKHSKEHFREIVDILHRERAFEKIINNTNEPLTPDTQLFTVLVKTGADAWDITFLINLLIKRHNIAYSSLREENNMWNDFVNKCNQGLLKTDKAPEVFKLGIECGRQFCQRCKTLGGIAIWVSESIERRQRDEAQANLE